MAATPSDPSATSSKTTESKAEAATSTKVTAAAPPPQAEDAPPPQAEDAEAPSRSTDSALKAPPMPTYESSERSQHFIVAKSLLKEGDFETALSTLEEGIQETIAALGGDGEPYTFHESLAPFHYLYGTTLLYSIEESTDGAQQMTVGDEDNVDDMQIAWENLDTARTIFEHMIAEKPSDKLKVDLAQVLLREGDLQRQNGNYDAAILDYSNCLECLHENSTVQPYSRKIADVHYNLGMVNLTLVAAAADSEAAVDAKQRDAARSQGFQHLYECGKVFAGIIAEIGGIDPEKVVRDAESSIPNFKTTGDDADEHPKIISLKLRSLQNSVRELKIDCPEVEDLIAVLEEIQETVDEADNSEKGLHEATAMKEQIAAAVAAQVDDVVEGFGSVEAAATTAAAAQPTTMVVKKKREAEENEAKMPAQDPAKRPKSE